MPNITVPASDPGLPNRRLFLAAGSAGAVFSALAAAASQVSPAAAVSPDLLALIEEHRTAEEAYRIALEAEDEALTRFETFKTKANADFVRQWPSKWRGDFDDLATSRTELIGLLKIDHQSLCRAIDHAFAPMRRKLFDIWEEHVEDVLKAFDDLVARTSAAEEETGYSKAAKQLEQAEEAVDSIFLQICAWPCASLAEVQLKATHLIERSDEIGWVRRDALLHSLAGHPPAEV